MRLVKKVLTSAILVGFCLVAGCADNNPGNWSQQQVADKMTERFELTDITINPASSGGFEGSGTRADGETITFQVTMDPDNYRINWDAQGDRGFIETDGFYEIVR